MKFELEVVKFNTADVITASNGDSGCANPAFPAPIGNAGATCPVAFVG